MRDSFRDLGIGLLFAPGVRLSADGRQLPEFLATLFVVIPALPAPSRHRHDAVHHRHDAQRPPLMGAIMAVGVAPALAFGW